MNTAESQSLHLIEPIASEDTLGVSGVEGETLETPCLHGRTVQIEIRDVGVAGSNPVTPTIELIGISLPGNSAAASPQPERVDLWRSDSSS
jgi:hypothetical protein